MCLTVTATSTERKKRGRLIYVVRLSISEFFRSRQHTVLAFEEYTMTVDFVQSWHFKALLTSIVNKTFCFIKSRNTAHKPNMLTFLVHELEFHSSFLCLWPWTSRAINFRHTLWRLMFTLFSNVLVWLVNAVAAGKTHQVSNYKWLKKQTHFRKKQHRKV